MIPIKSEPTDVLPQINSITSLTNPAIQSPNLNSLTNNVPTTLIPVSIVGTIPSGLIQTNTEEPISVLPINSSEGLPPPVIDTQMSDNGGSTEKNIDNNEEGSVPQANEKVSPGSKAE